MTAATPPETMARVWEDHAVVATIESAAGRTWTFGAVLLETILLWFVLVSSFGPLAALLSIPHGFKAGVWGTTLFAAYLVIAAIWLPWQARNRSARVQIRIDQRAVQIRSFYRVFGRYRDIHLEHFKRVFVDRKKRTLHIELRGQRRIDLALPGAAVQDLQWIAQTIEQAADQNKRFWLEELSRDPTDRRALETVIEDTPSVD